jgi:hypothetical protein
VRGLPVGTSKDSSLTRQLELKVSLPRALKSAGGQRCPMRSDTPGGRWSPVLTATLVLVGAGMHSGVATADPPQPQEPKSTIDRDGTFVVRTDIAAGVYSSPGPLGGGRCSWARPSSLNNSDIIDSAMSSRPQVVEIQTGDKLFKTDGCQPWRTTDTVGAQGPTIAEVPASAAEAQLHTYIDSLNLAARQLVREQLPRP